MALTDIQKVRIEVQDVDTALPFLPDSTYEYFLEKNNNSIRKASLDAARAILYYLSIRSQSEVVDVLSVTGGHKAAEQYRLALQLYLRDPSLNPVFTSVQGYAGGISNSDYESNLANTDNKHVTTPQEALQRETTSSSTLTNPFVF